jgi:GntR family transcriptional regulator
VHDVSAGPVRSPSPRYVSIAGDLRERILDQQLAPHTLMPSERELSEQLTVSRMTARRALTLLESEGYVYRRPPRGTFVAEPRVRFHIGSFSEEASRLGRHASAVPLWTKQTTDAPAAQAALGLAPDQPVHVFHRLRLMEDEPLALETTYFPADLTPGILDFTGGGSLWQELRERFGLRLDRSTAVLESVVLDEEACGQLGVRTATNGILLTRTTVDAEGRCVEYARDVYRADRAAFEVTASLPR